MSGTNAQLIVLHHTPTDTNVPDPLYAGEAAVAVGPTKTKLWVGEGPPTNINRLLLSTDPTDSPLLNQTALGGPFLPLKGGTLDTLTTATDGTSGLGLTINNNDTTWTNPALRINNTAQGIAINNSGDGLGLDISGNGYTHLNLQMFGANQSYGMQISQGSTNVNSVGLRVTAGAANTTAVSIVSGSANTTSLLIDSTAPAADPRQIVLQRTNAAAAADTMLAAIRIRGRTGAATDIAESARITATATQGWSATANGTRLDFQVTPNGTVGPQTAMTIDQNRTVSVWDGTQMVPLPGAGIDDGEYT